MQAIRDEGGQAGGFSVDVTDQAGMEEAVKTVESALGPIDILVNNAGVIAPTGRDWELEPEEYSSLKSLGKVSIRMLQGR